MNHIAQALGYGVMAGAGITAICFGAYAVLNYCYRTWMVSTEFLTMWMKWKREKRATAEYRAMKAAKAARDE